MRLIFFYSELSQSIFPEYIKKKFPISIKHDNTEKLERYHIKKPTAMRTFSEILLRFNFFLLNFHFTKKT